MTNSRVHADDERRIFGIELDAPASERRIYGHLGAEGLVVSESVKFPVRLRAEPDSEVTQRQKRLAKRRIGVPTRG